MNRKNWEPAPKNDALLQDCFSFDFCTKKYDKYYEYSVT